VDDPWVRCTACGYKQGWIDTPGMEIKSLGVGELLGLGLAALFASSEGRVETRRTRVAQALRRRARTSLTFALAHGGRGGSPHRANAAAAQGLRSARHELARFVARQLDPLREG
jgi:hypothetical protein